MWNTKFRRTTNFFFISKTTTTTHYCGRECMSAMCVWVWVHVVVFFLMKNRYNIVSVNDNQNLHVYESAVSRHSTDVDIAKQKNKQIKRNKFTAEHFERFVCFPSTYTWKCSTFRLLSLRTVNTHTHTHYTSTHTHTTHYGIRYFCFHFLSIFFTLSAMNGCQNTGVTTQWSNKMEFVNEKNAKRLSKSK